MKVRVIFHMLMNCLEKNCNITVELQINMENSGLYQICRSVITLITVIILCNKQYAGQVTGGAPIYNKYHTISSINTVKFLLSGNKNVKCYKKTRF